MTDPVTGSMIMSGIGAGISAMGTIAGGNNAAALGQSQQNQYNYQADQLRENASSEIGAAQRQMFDTQQKTRLAEGKITANAGGSGFVASSGSAENISQSVARRGSYEAAMQLFQGENASTGDLNKAAGDVMSGELAKEGGQMQKEASEYAAVGNLASSAGSMFKTYGTMKGMTPSVSYG